MYLGLGVYNKAFTRNASLRRQKQNVHFKPLFKCITFPRSINAKQIRLASDDKATKTELLIILAPNEVVIFKDELAIFSCTNKIHVFGDTLSSKIVISKPTFTTPLALLKTEISLQLGKVFSSDNGVSVPIMYSYTY